MEPCPTASDTGINTLSIHRSVKLYKFSFKMNISTTAQYVEYERDLNITYSLPILPPTRVRGDGPYHTELQHKMGPGPGHSQKPRWAGRAQENTYGNVSILLNRDHAEVWLS